MHALIYAGSLKVIPVEHSSLIGTNSGRHRVFWACQIVGLYHSAVTVRGCLVEGEEKKEREGKNKNLAKAHLMC